MATAAVTASELSRMLSIALIEIRATSSLRAAQALADIFHNVPSALEHGLSPDETYSRLLECAERNEMRSHIERLREHVSRGND